MWFSIIFVVIFVIACLAGIIYTAKRNNEIKNNGIQTSAVVSKIEETESTDSDGISSGVIYKYFVTYQTQDGRYVEARLVSGKSIDNQNGPNSWNHDLYEGCSVYIKYLPEKPNYVIRVWQ